jgi:hypothetical protein
VTMGSFTKWSTLNHYDNSNVQILKGGVIRKILIKYLLDKYMRELMSLLGITLHICVRSCRFKNGSLDSKGLVESGHP